MKENNVSVIFESAFNSGLGIFNSEKKRICIVPECTYHDDDAYRIVLRNENVIFQIEDIDTLEWKDLRDLGLAKDLYVSGYNEEGEHDVHIPSDTPLLHLIS